MIQFLVGCFFFKKSLKKNRRGRYRGTSICGVRIFEWVLICQNFVVMVSVGTYIRCVLVFDGYVYSRVYGIHTSYVEKLTIVLTGPSELSQEL